MVQPIKQLMVEEYKTQFRDMDSCVVLDYSGLSATEADELRHSLRAHNIDLRVIRNRLAARALAEVGLGQMGQLLRGQCAIARGDDVVVLCRTLQAWMKERQKLAIRGGLLARAVITPEQVVALAQVPPREELYARMAGLLAAPLMRLGGALLGIHRQIACALEEIRKKKVSEPAPSAAGETASGGEPQATAAG